MITMEILQELYQVIAFLTLPPIAAMEYLVQHYITILFEFVTQLF